MSELYRAKTLRDTGLRFREKVVNLLENTEWCLSPAQNNVLFLTWEYARESERDLIIADSLSNTITKNLSLDEPLDNRHYLSYVRMLRASSFLELLSIYKGVIVDYLEKYPDKQNLLESAHETITEGVNVMSQYIQSRGQEFSEKTQECVEYNGTQKILNVYSDILLDDLTSGKTACHFDEIVDVPTTVASTVTGLSVSRISHLVADGKLESKKFEGYIRYVDMNSLKSYLDSIKAPDTYIQDDVTYRIVTTASETEGIDLSHKWIIQLIKKEKVRGVQVEEYNRRWYVNLDSLRNYIRQTQSLTSS